MKRLKSKPADPRETKRKIRAALGKHRCGEPLTATEKTVVYWHLCGGACHVCGSVKVAVVDGGGARYGREPVQGRHPGAHDGELDRLPSGGGETAGGKEADGIS